MTRGLTFRWSWRIEARSSTSSTNTTAAGSSRIRSRISAKALASCSGLSADNSLGWISMKGHSNRELIPLANVVLPVPGGPNSTTALGGWTACRSASSGSRKRKDDPSLDDLLRLVHPLQHVPQMAVDDDPT